MNALKVLEPYVSNLSRSKPIFSVETSYTGIKLTILPEAKYKPESDPSDAFSVLIKDSYREGTNFYDNKISFSSLSEETVGAALASVRTSFCVFLEKNIPTKAPTQTALYRGFRKVISRSSNSSDFMYGVLLLYRYAYDVTSGTMMFSDKKSPHLKNILTILETMVDNES